MKKRLEIERGTLHEIVQRLTRVVGIDADSLEGGRMHWTIESRCRHLSFSTAEQYAEYLNVSQEELTELIDALVIQETRFFRDTAVFEQLRVWAQSAAASFQGRLRILSAPCSTGQEAYSIAAVLRVAGISPSEFVIDAFDISRTALATAARGVYPAGALQNVPPELQGACGVLRDHHWHMHEDVRHCIRFQRRNLALAGALDDESGYHLVLCRNLFIYLHAGARAALAESLSRALLPGGRLIVGAGDRVAELNARFVPVKPAAGFGFTHRTNGPPAANSNRAYVPPVQVRVAPFQFANATSVMQPAPSPAAEFYRRAVEYRERGNLRQAERRCRQALYLAPGYLPALELLQTLWQVHPNSRLHRALSARILRVRSDREGFPGTPSLAEETPS